MHQLILDNIQGVHKKSVSDNQDIGMRKKIHFGLVIVCSLLYIYTWFCITINNTIENMFRVLASHILISSKIFDWYNETSGWTTRVATQQMNKEE